MKLLAFDTSAGQLSVGVRCDAPDVGPAMPPAAAQRMSPPQLFLHEGAGGAQASATLIPVCLQLLAQAGLALDALDAIVFGAGPGSFTGLRTACAVAQGLAAGARQGRGLPVLPVDTLLAVAETARLQWRQDPAHAAAAAQPLHVLALLDARMDEVYHAAYVWQAHAHPPLPDDAGRWQALTGLSVAPPEAVSVPTLATSQHWLVAGNALAVYAQRLTGLPPAASRMPVLPSARALLQLAPTLLAAGQAVAADLAQPVYIRDKVALTVAERAALAVATD